MKISAEDKESKYTSHLWVRFQNGDEEALEGSTLPDATTITSALAFSPFSAPRALFTLNTPKTVSFGISANFVQDQQWFRIKQVKMTQFVNIFD